jgi:hypothetical protein
MDITVVTGGATTGLSAYKEIGGYLIAVVGGAIALWRYWNDQNWKRKQFAYDYAERMLADERALSALRMLDWTNGSFSKPIIEEFSLSDGTGENQSEDETSWNQADVCWALRHHGPSQMEPDGALYPPREYAIRSLFDHALAYFERLGEFVRTGVITKQDFPNTLAYYITLLNEPRLAPLRGPLLNYAEQYRYTSTLYLFRLFLVK